MGILLPIIMFPILLLMVVAVFFMVLASIGRGWGPVFKGMRGGRAVCGNCGHEVSLPRVDVCAECGAPYEVAGVATRAAAIRLGPPLLLVALILFATAVVFSLVTTPIVVGAVGLLGPAGQGQYRVTGVAAPVSGAVAAPGHEVRYESVTRLSPGDSPSGVISSTDGEVVVTLAGPAVEEASLELSRGTSAWVVRDASGSRVAKGEGVESGVEALYGAAGEGVVWGGAGAERAAVVELARRAVEGGQVDWEGSGAVMEALEVQSTRTTVHSAGMSAWWLVLAAVVYQAVPLFLLVVGLLWINTIRRRALGIEVVTTVDEEDGVVAVG